MLLISLCDAAQFKWNAQVDFQSHVYFERLTEPTRTEDQVINFEPSLDIVYNRRSRMLFRPQFRSNLSTSESPENFFFNAKEMYWEIKLSKLRTKIGSNTHNWGVMDAYSPLDVTNGRTLFNPLAGDKRGAPGLDFQYDVGGMQFQALYIPYQARTLLPSTDSRWLPRSLLINTVSGNDTLLLPDEFKYYYPGSEGVTEAVQNNYGFKISGRSGDSDWGLAFFEGSSITPHVRPVVTADVISIDPNILQARSDIGLIPVYYRQQTMGFQWVWAPSDWIVKFETAYAKTRMRSPLIPDWFWQSAIGFEKPVNIGSQQVIFVLQAYYAENKEPANNLVSSSIRLFDRAAALGARWAYSDQGSVLLTSLYNYEDNSYYVRLSWDRRFYEKFQLQISGDLLEGDPETLIGTYNSNDRIIAQLSYFW